MRLYTYSPLHNNNKNKLKDEAKSFAYKNPDKNISIRYNKPLITANKVNLDYYHYSINSPNNYKQNYYTSNFCRNYMKPNILSPIFASHEYKYKNTKPTNIDNLMNDSKVTFNSLYKSKLFTPNSVIKKKITFGNEVSPRHSALNTSNFNYKSFTPSNYSSSNNYRSFSNNKNRFVN